MIGIIGGNGVAATNKLCAMIETTLTHGGAVRDAHHPQMLVWQATQAPSRSMYLEGKGASFVDDYVNIAQKMKAAGASSICMCCNTAHYAIEEIQRRSHIPFLNMVEEVVLTIKNCGAQHVGLMASDGCRMGRVYERYFEMRCPHARIVYPSDEMQKEITRGICNIKNKNRFLPDNHADRPKNIFRKAYNHLTENGVDIVILGCTDISVDFHAPSGGGGRIVDSLNILKEMIINYYK
jgi:aspartate racemase